MSIVSLTAWGQGYEVTQEGLRSWSDMTQTYLVFEVAEASAQKLYDNALSYVNENYANPNQAIVGNTNGKYLKFTTNESNVADGSIQVKYVTELRFKEGRMRYEIVSLQMTTGGARLLFCGKSFSDYVIYKSNGKLVNPEAKSAIEQYFQERIDALREYVEAENTQDW